MPHQNSKDLAAKIATIIENESRPSNLSSILESINAISKRLDKIEASLVPQSAIPNPQSMHPSVDRFSIAEAIADEMFSGIQKEKACTFEPNGKPCDHCSMCSSRGF
jgi:hypothetical protein